MADTRLAETAALIAQGKGDRFIKRHFNLPTRDAARRLMREAERSAARSTAGTVTANGPLSFHPLANIFPLIEGDEFDQLAASIKASNGPRDPIILHEGMILDGRNRYRACGAAGVGARYELLPTDVDPLAFVIDKNLKRRHLDESQRAMVAARLANMRQGERTDLSEPSANLRKVDQPTAAKALSISERALQSAKAVQERGTPELVRAVDRGHLAVSAAAQALRLAPEKQREVATRAEAGEESAARNVIKQETRTAREVDLGEKQRALPDIKAGVILADPEWRFEPWSRTTGLDRAADNHYPTSCTEVIAARDVPSVAAPDCVLFLWATNPMLPHALLVMAAWGFDYKSNYAWAKDKAGTGYWNREKHELLLIGVKGNIPCPAPGTQWDSLITAPRGAHSEKPDTFYEMIESYFPTLPKLELNARKVRPGWIGWGNEYPADAEYDSAKDVEGCFNDAYTAVRERMANGGPGWTPKS